jgi:hypothetical protein
LIFKPDPFPVATAITPAPAGESNVIDVVTAAKALHLLAVETVHPRLLLV